MKLRNKKGIWFYGLAGSGKSYASHVLSQRISESFIIDGDDARKYISFDLNYSSEHRLIQITRLLGLAKIVIKNDFFPIISSVTMSGTILNELRKIDIDVVEIRRSAEQRQKVREIYEKSLNVVGKDIKPKSLKTRWIENFGTSEFDIKILEYVK